MKNNFYIFTTLALLLFLSSCSVISTGMRQEAEPDASYWKLHKMTDIYLGKTVILGGSIIETVPGKEETLILVLQSPLDITHSPVSKDRSEGRFIVVYPGFLDPEVYSKGRLITVAGIVAPPEYRKIDKLQVKHLKINSRELHLHPEKQPVYGLPVYEFHPYYNHHWHGRWYHY